MKTFTTAEAAAESFRSSERWLLEQIRADRFPASKVGRSWLMTEQDIADSLEICRNAAPRPEPKKPDKATQFAGMTPTTRRRVAGL